MNPCIDYCMNYLKRPFDSDVCSCECEYVRAVVRENAYFTALNRIKILARGTDQVDSKDIMEIIDSVKVVK